MTVIVVVLVAVAGFIGYKVGYVEGVYDTKDAALSRYIERMWDKL